MREPAESDDTKKRSTKKPERITRADEAEKRGEEPTLPEVEPEFFYLFEDLMDVGPVVSNGMGTAALEWRDLKAWSGLVATALQPWEARLLRRLSHVYVSESRRAEARDAKPPWDEPQTDQKQVADSMRDSMRQLNQM